MANIKISALTPVTTVVPGTDVAPLVSGGITTKATPQQIVNAGLLAPGAIGSGTASTGAFTTLSASSTVSGTGFSTYLASPPAIGATAPSTGKFTTIESTIATGTAPFTVASTTNVANLNASSLGGATFAAPGAIGSGTASTGAFTTLSASSTVSGTGFSTYLLSPPAIGTTAPAAGKFTDLTSTGNTTIGDASTDTFTVYPQTISLINSTAITAASTKTLTLNGGAGSNGLVIDASNNVGLGLAPNAWGSGYKGLQLSTGISLMGGSVNGNLTANCYFDGTNWKYIQSSVYANNFYVNYANNGSFVWSTAASGTAGNAITFTQSMSLDASSNLTIAGATATKASGTTWANPSDTRLKDNQQLYTKGLDELLQIVVKTWEFNGKGGSSKGIKGLGVIADEIELVLPESVDTYSAKLNIEDEYETEIKRFDASPVIWLLVKSVQELSAELNELKHRIK